MKEALRRKLDSFFEALFPTEHVRLGSAVHTRLLADPINVADVGAVFGPDPRWSQLGRKTCRFLTFEPDKRSHEESGNAGPFEMLALPTALSSEPGKQTLHLTSGEFASSLYPPNEAVLSAYCTWPWHELVGEDELAVDTLDNCLADHPGWAPDFIKTDVEGADLDVLKGAEKGLSGALGLQVEAAFVERNVGAPLFAEIDQFLRARGFTFFQLLREHWGRRNGLQGPASRPQLIWADVVYFRELDEFRARLASAADDARREAMLTKFVVMLLVHGHHDYALDVVEMTLDAKYCSSRLADELRSTITASCEQPCAFAFRGTVALVAAGCICLAALPLGAAARRQSRVLYRRLAGRLYHHLYRESVRGGLQQGCISDLP